MVERKSCTSIAQCLGMTTPDMVFYLAHAQSMQWCICSFVGVVDLNVLKILHDGCSTFNGYCKQVCASRFYGGLLKIFFQHSCIKAHVPNACNHNDLFFLY